MGSAVMLAVLISGAVGAQPDGPPPAKVTLGEVTQGTLAPSTLLPGTVYFHHVSELATEVSGKVVEVLFDHGQHLPKGAPMVCQDATLLEAELNVARATVRQNEALLEQEMVRLDRARQLLADEVTTPQEFDDIRFTVDSLRHGLDASQAQVARLEQELKKKTTYAPYDGVVVSRETELGEWKRDGDVIAVFAQDGVYDVVVNLPEAQLPSIRVGKTVEVRIQQATMPGEIVAVVPRGDVATRTFPIRIQVTHDTGLLEGMSADVIIRQGDPVQTLMVPRDAVMTSGDQSAVFTVKDGTAVRVPVTILGYEGLRAGVRSDELSNGLPLVVKGHERLRPGQAVEVLQ